MTWLHRGIAFFLVALLLLGPSAPALGAPKEPTNPGKMRVWVSYANGRSAEVRQALKQANAGFHYDFQGLGAYVVTLPAAAAVSIRNNSDVVLVEEDPVRYPIAATPSTGSREALAAQDTADPDGDTVPYGIDMVQARDVWDPDRNGVPNHGLPAGANRTLCIIDSGYYQDHEDLPAAGGGYSQVDDNALRDGYGHGSHVGGTIAAQNNGLGVVGVTPGTVDLQIVKIFGDDGAWVPFASNLVDALNRCVMAGANVVSMSLGGPTSSTLERRAFDDAYTAGVLSIAAAGNAGTTAVSYPAGYASVVSVAAIDSSKVVAAFSQYNADVELAAPGVAVRSTLPYTESNSLTTVGITYGASHVEYSARGTASGALVNGGLCGTADAWTGKVVLCARGTYDFYTKVQSVQTGGGVAAAIYNNAPGSFLGTLGDGNSSAIPAISLSQEDGQYLVANRLGATAAVDAIRNWPASGYEAWDGTSMATPHVSAVAALVWSANPTWTNAQVRTALQNSAEDLGAAGRDVYYGYGLVRAAVALSALGYVPPANTAPVTEITDPADGASVAVGTEIIFSASANDAEEGALSAALQWREGGTLLSTGASFSRSDLPVGSHTLTASVADSWSETGSDSVTVIVTEIPTAVGELVVWLGTGQDTYADGDRAGITVLVTDRDGAPVTGATVTIVVTPPRGRSTTYVRGAGDSAGVEVSYRVNARKTATGTYRVDATASLSEYVDGTGQAAFRVQ